MGGKKPSQRQTGICESNAHITSCCCRYPPVVPNSATFYIFCAERRGGWNSADSDLSVGGKSRTDGEKKRVEAAEHVGTNHPHAWGYLTGNCSTFLRPRGLLGGINGHWEGAAAQLWQRLDGVLVPSATWKKILPNVPNYFGLKLTKPVSILPYFPK